MSTKSNLAIFATHSERASTPSGDPLFEYSPEAQLLFDPYNDRFLRANQIARHLLGLTETTLAEGRPSMVFGQDVPQLIVFTQAVLEKGHATMDRLVCRHASQTEMTFECHARRVQWSSSPAVLISLRDIEQRQQLQAAADAQDFMRKGAAEWRRIEKLFAEIERENQMILRAAGEGIYGLDANGLTTFVNPAAARMLGYRVDELVGRNMHRMLHHTHSDGSHYPACECPIYAAIKDGCVRHSVNEIFWRKDGSAFPVEYTSTPLKDSGSTIGAVVVFRDVSERKQAEDQLRQAMQELESLKLRLEQENAYLQEEIREEHNFHEIIGRSEVLGRIIRRIELVAPTEATVLITGESGTGKELIARAIHQDSQRADHPLIRVNCAAVPRELFESEFFGHVKGAFTGAMRDRAGRFELANGGTLFLDEIGEIPLELQSKLLRVLQEGQFERVGSDRTLETNVRLIAATNRDLKNEVAKGRFREDLYFRLNVFPIHAAPLRERSEDIPLLATHFLQLIGRRMGREGLHISEHYMQRLQTYHWPGNIRELQNLLERAVIVAPGPQVQIELPDAVSHQTSSNKRSDTDRAVILTEQERRERDKQVIVQALAQCNGKVFGPGGAAEALGLKPTTLASRIKRWGITMPESSV